MKYIAIFCFIAVICSPVLGSHLEDGVYSADFRTDSSMFHVNEAYDGKGVLTVEGGRMTIHVTMPSKQILKLFCGKAADAALPGAVLIDHTIDVVTHSDGFVEKAHGFDIPVPYLDNDFDCALVGKKGKWYDHKVSVSNPVPAGKESGKTSDASKPDFSFGLKVTGSMKLDFADQFSVDYYEGGYKLITLADGSRFFIVPEGKTLPEGADKLAFPLYQPIKNIYLAATSAMCLFDSLDRLDAIRLSGAKAEGWYIPKAKKAMEEGKILFAGRYNAPDYELITASKCPLAIESTMIGHALNIKKQLELLDIAVLVDQSGHENHPLGRSEWIKLYGALLNEEEKAEQVFAEQAGYLAAVKDSAPSGKKVAFFYVNSSGKIVARKSGDYVSRMIALAGGKYIFDNLGDDSGRMSTVSLEPEYFYSEAKDADIIIYNATIADEISSVSQMVGKSPLLADFKAVRTGNVWCTTKNMYQETTELGQMINSLHEIFSDSSAGLSKLPFFYRLK